MSAARHRVTVEAQTWRNNPPYLPHTLYRAVCTCGERGPWYSYRDNVELACPARAAGDPE